MIINGQTLANMNVAYNAAFKNGFAEPDTYWDKVATMVTSTTKSNEYGWLGDLPGFREWIGDRVMHEISGHGYAIKNKPFEMTVSVEREDIEDDNLGIYTPLITEMGRAAKVHPDELVYAALKNAFTTACYDGQNFFDTDHPVKVGNATTSVSNVIAGGENPWFLMDTSRALKPLIYQKRKDYQFVSKDDEKDDNLFWKKKFVYGSDGRGNVGYGFWQMAVGATVELDAAAFREARGMMRGLKNDAGKPLGLNPKVLVVGVGNSDAARDVLLRDRIDGSSNPDFKLAEIVEVPWLD